ncbi:hypothetical protein D9615_009191 [Tricholomella constricta]|uniref:Uncharacterized protein n=1 Tax=Tricholomella constricta TaxID=117010 RepID=A0A8H5H2N2_9AGAR|nr:hypothetical protein D9615_009191 [Tricholomella constricta]
MSHTSPASLLVWAVICCLLGIFLIFHLWSFDRFKCLKWNSGPSSGAFKRVMTYTYLLTVPLIGSYAIGFATIKYHEGFIFLPEFGIIPKPHQLWGPTASSAIFPLMLMFSIGWSFEMVTHLEELCFWLFLVNSGSAQQDWFHSLYFKTWVVGSTVAVIYMPLVTIFTRSDPLKSEAYTFLAGSLGSLSLTLWFTPILWTFPSFLRNLKNEGVDINTIVRLTKFSELNTIRVAFRFLFTVPLLILGIDGVRPHHHINENMLWTDFLAILAGFGCSISSGITLVIFFPRSIEGEIAARDASKERKRTRSRGNTGSVFDSRADFAQSNMTQSIPTNNKYSSPVGGAASGTYLLSSPVKRSFQELEDRDEPTDEQMRQIPPSMSVDKYWAEEERDALPNLPPIRPNRRKGADIELGGVDMTEENLSKHDLRESNVNHMVHNFTSPIDLAYASGQQPQHPNGSWLSFSRQ